jgi:hypothetical protein
MSSHPRYSAHRVSPLSEYAEDDMFDAIVGRLEDIMMGERAPLHFDRCADMTMRTRSAFAADEDFQKLQSDFVRKHCVHFDDSEENKLIYIDIFNEYVTTT